MHVMYLCIFHTYICVSTVADLPYYVQYFVVIVNILLTLIDPSRLGCPSRPPPTFNLERAYLYERDLAKTF